LSTAINDFANKAPKSQRNEAVADDTVDALFPSLMRTEASRGPRCGHFSINAQNCCAVNGEVTRQKQQKSANVACITKCPKWLCIAEQCHLCKLSAVANVGGLAQCIRRRSFVCIGLSMHALFPIYGWQVNSLWVNCPLRVSQLGQLSLPSLRGSA